MTIESERTRNLLSFIVGYFQDQTIDGMEKSVALTTSVEEMPGPNTWHPAFSHVAESIIRVGRKDVIVPDFRRTSVGLMSPEKMYPDSDDIVRTTLMHRTLAYGRMPFVGNPEECELMYVWPVWRDLYGRWIAGEAEIKKFWNRRYRRNWWRT